MLGEELTVDIRQQGVDAHRARVLERALRSVVGVRSVIAVFEDEDRA